MKSTRTDLAALAVVVVAIAAIVTLSLAHQSVPEILSTVALVALGIGGGIAIPSRTSAGDAAATAASEAVTVLERAVPIQPGPPALETAPVATHAP